MIWQQPIRPIQVRHKPSDPPFDWSWQDVLFVRVTPDNQFEYLTTSGLLVSSEKWHMRFVTP